MLFCGVTSSGKTITYDQEREFVPPLAVVVERDLGEREQLAICMAKGFGIIV